MRERKLITDMRVIYVWIPVGVNQWYNYLNGSRWIPWRGLIPRYKWFWHVDRHLSMGTCGQERQGDVRFSSAVPHDSDDSLPLSWFTESIVSISMSLLYWWLMLHSSKLYRDLDGFSSSTNSIPVPDFRRGLRDKNQSRSLIWTGT